MKKYFIISGLILAGYISMRLTNAQDLLARTIFGEARGEGRAGMEAVAWVVMNRVNSSRYPNTVAGVVFQEWQFSAFNTNDPNRIKLLSVTSEDAVFPAAQQEQMAELLPNATRFHFPGNHRSCIHALYGPALNEACRDVARRIEAQAA